MITGDQQQQRTRHNTGHLGVLGEVEAEDWHLDHVGYVWQETGSVSRDKLLSSGQTAAVHGQIVGIYLFRRV